MKINQEKVQERLKHVPSRERAFIYDASTVIRFLSKTFMPTTFFLPKNLNLQPGQHVVPTHVNYKLVDPEDEMSMRDLYDLYLLFREEESYTVKIESRYVFSLIIRNLRVYQNGWEFWVRRRGRDQIWHVGPLRLRKDVPKEAAKEFPVPKTEPTAEESIVKADPVSSPDEFVTEIPFTTPPMKEQVQKIQDFQGFVQEKKLEEDQRIAEAILNTPVVLNYTDEPSQPEEVPGDPNAPTPDY